MANFSDKFGCEEQESRPMVNAHVMGAKVQSFYDAMMSFVDMDAFAVDKPGETDYQRGRREAINELWEIYSITFEEVIQPWRGK